ncbi:unnamed protein product [Cuscuta campestris]|uniref:Uncharacterized protein n=1 Tax=Cuscuta campestris TaxID=132261 RepID=A0A484K565_9ASTE|nr:unnamed protein product [Cuscuta campestris]
MKSENYSCISIVSETPNVFASEEELDDSEKNTPPNVYGEQEIEQLPPNVLGDDGEMVAAVVPDSEDEDEASDASMVLSSGFVCIRNHACDSFLKLMFPGWDSPKLT